MVGRGGHAGPCVPMTCLSGPPKTWPSRPPLISGQGDVRGAGVRALEPGGGPSVKLPKLSGPQSFICKMDIAIAHGILVRISLG